MAKQTRSPASETCTQPIFVERPSIAILISCVIVAGFCGGSVGRWWAIMMPWLDGGVPVSLSTFGEVFFFLVGAVAGSIASIVVTLIFGNRIEAQWNVVKASLISVVVGCVAAPLSILMLDWTFFTIPHELFDLLTD